ncbi:hypothetical protein JCM9279_001247 [Rhodotorula babjevae]
MSYTTDEGNLFQSDAQHQQSAERAARAHLLADRGSPIKLASKPLRVVVRDSKASDEPDAWVAESGFVVRRVGLESGKTKQIYKGHGGPVTSLAFHSSNGRELLISGSWDKSFRVWDAQTKTLLSTTVGHIDFVKTLLVLPSLNLLVTGSSDKDIRLWDLSPLDDLDIPALASAPVATTSTAPDAAPPPQQTGAAPPPAVALRPLPCVCALKGHLRPIEQLAAYPILRALPPGLSEDEAEMHPREETGAVALVSADSMGALKAWELSRNAEGAVKGELRCEVREHELGVYDMSLGEDGLWTASADNSVLLSSLDRSSPSTPPTPILRIPHPAQTRSLLPLSHASAACTLSLLRGVPPPPILVTGASDELLRVWDLDCSALDPSASREAQRAWRGVPAAPSAKLDGCVRAIEGHAHEVVQLCAYADRAGELWVLSASLDATLRRWRWSEMREGAGERLVLVPVEDETQAGGEEKESLLTEEEERELAELMGED